MVTIYNDKGKKIMLFVGKTEAMIRFVCENNQKFFKKKVDDSGKISFKLLSSVEARIDVGFVYLWKDYLLIFDIS